MSYTRDQWSRAFLAGIGNTNPTQNIVNWVINWTASEGSSVGGQGDYNLLNTTQSMPGSYGGGSQGNIQYFSDFASGVQANSLVLQNGLYPNLLNALQTNNEAELGFGGNPSSGVMSDLSTWCGGCGYGGWFAKQPPSQSWLQQQFSGTINTPIPTLNNSSQGLSNPLTLYSFLGLPSQKDLANFSEQLGIVIIGGLVVLVGVLILFLSTDTGKKALSVGEKAALA